MMLNAALQTPVNSSARAGQRHVRRQRENDQHDEVQHDAADIEPRVEAPALAHSASAIEPQKAPIPSMLARMPMPRRQMQIVLADHRDHRR